MTQRNEPTPTPPSSSKPQNGSISSSTPIKIPLGALMTCIGTLIAGSVGASFWLFSVKADITALRIDMDALVQTEWTISDQRNFTDQVEIMNSAIKMPPVVKVEETENGTPHSRK